MLALWPRRHSRVEPSIRTLHRLCQVRMVFPWQLSSRALSECSQGSPTHPELRPLQVSAFQTWEVGDQPVPQKAARRKGGAGQLFGGRHPAEGCGRLELTRPSNPIRPAGAHRGGFAVGTPPSPSRGPGSPGRHAGSRKRGRPAPRRGPAHLRTGVRLQETVRSPLGAPTAPRAQPVHPADPGGQPSKHLPRSKPQTHPRGRGGPDGQRGKGPQRPWRPRLG